MRQGNAALRPPGAAKIVGDVDAFEANHVAAPTTVTCRTHEETLRWPNAKRTQH